MLLWFSIVLLHFSRGNHASTLAAVPHGTFEGISVPSGMSSVLFVDLPLSSSFVLIQLHSPFNPILASVVPSFDYGASQNSEHCGLVSILGNNVSNVTLYLYSGYEDVVSAWVRADAYSSDFPIPGGCGRHLLEDASCGALCTETMTTPSSFANITSNAYLRFWTSLLNFNAASLPGQLSEFHCSNDTLSDRLTYRLYSIPLVTAGGSYWSFVNPTPYEVAGLLKGFISTTDDFGTQSHTFKIRPTVLKKGSVELPISRRPGTAVLLKLVVEYNGDTERTRVAYAPVVLYGCRGNAPAKSGVGSAFLVQRYSTQLSCGVLPTDAPNLYFLVAVLLIASLFYGCSCHLLVWPRCAASVMVVASLIGTIFFFRYSSSSSYATLLLIMCILIPGLMALVVFIVIWCLCIRPTLHYQQVYGRGPLLKLVGSEKMSFIAPAYEPWDSDLLLDNARDRQTANLPRLSREFRSIPLNLSSSIIEGQPIYGTFETRSPSKAESDEQLLGISTPWLAALFSRFRCSRGYSEGSARLFSLKPRRIARLPPVLPAGFLLVACFSVLLDQPLSLNASPAAYLSFAILMNILLTGLLCVFKNLAFGISTAFVGVYLSLGCLCLFLIPNAVLPHIFIEQFLRLTWIEQRLETVRIDFFGVYDIFIIVAWIVGTLVFGLLTLCLVRLKDARELAEAQHSRSICHPPDPQASSPPSLVPAVEVIASSNDSLLPSNRFTPPTTTTITDGDVHWSLASIVDPLSRAGYEETETGSFGEFGHVRSTYLPAGRSVAIPNLPCTSSSSLFGGCGGGGIGAGLANTRKPPLMPLSRVQLASGGPPGAAHSLSSSVFRPVTTTSHTSSVVTRHLTDGTNFKS